MKKKLIIASFLCAAVGVAAVVWVVCTPMTMCLTFDDGNVAHAKVAAPTLEKYGWRGAFNIVTARIGRPDISFCEMMKWSDVETLFKNGHEVYPHTHFPDLKNPMLSHYNLRKLAEAGDFKAIEYQVRESKKMIEDKLGVTPSMFCLPFNAMNDDVAKIIRSYGMEPLNCDRRNFPTHPGHKIMSISDYVKAEWRKGSGHVDIMMHGIVRAEGGWEPFEDAAHFDRFCRELKDVENSGIVRIVGYAESHNYTKWGGGNDFSQVSV